MNENPWSSAPETPQALADELERVNDKLDRLMNAVGMIDRRRGDLEEMLADLLPAANGAVTVATNHLWDLEQKGTLNLARETFGALEAASRGIDLEDLRALGHQAGPAVRTLRALTGPDVTAASARTVQALQNARTGRPPGFFTLLRRLRKPHVRRGLAAALDILEGLGEGAHPDVAPRPDSAPSLHRSAAAPPAPVPSARPVSLGTPAPQAVAVPTGLTVGGRTVALDPDGCLVDSAQWTREVAEAIADQAGVGPLTDEHWRVLEFCRLDAERSGGAPGLRRITKELDIPPKDMYRLFPKGPGTLAARLAGLQKPKSCV